MISKKKWGITIDVVNVCVCVQVEPIIIKYCKNSKIQSFSSVWAINIKIVSSQ